MPRKKASESNGEYFNNRVFSEAKTEEARENQMIELTKDLVEYRLRNGTASSQETTQYLKLGSVKARLELEVLEKQKELLEAKITAVKESKTSSEKLDEALKAFKKYSGNEDVVDD